jgi:hypothetical protein
VRLGRLFGREARHVKRRQASEDSQCSGFHNCYRFNYDQPDYVRCHTERPASMFFSKFEINSYFYILKIFTRTG